MKAQKVLVLLLAIVSGAVAMVGASQYMKNQGGTVQATPTVEILVAVEELRIDAEFNEENVRLEPWPADRVPLDAVRSFEEVDGQFAGARLFPGEPILAAKVTATKKTVTGDIPEGFRVVSIRVQIDTSVAGLLRPGDRVDVNLFLRKSTEVAQSTMKTLLHDVTVFAVDSETEREIDGDGKAIDATTVSLLLPPQQAKKVTLADKLGDLSLTLRGENASEEEDDSTVAGEVTIDDILGRSDNAAEEEMQDDSPKSTGTSASKFMDFMKNQSSDLDDPEPVHIPVSAPAPAEEEEPEGWQMTKFTSEGVTQFEWADESLLPIRTELGDGDGMKAPTFDENNASTH